MDAGRLTAISQLCRVCGHAGATGEMNKCVARLRPPITSERMNPRVQMGQKRKSDLDVGV
jgi:hypothetical protein